MYDHKSTDAPVQECHAWVSKHSDPHVKECHTKVCRGKILPLLFDMGRALSEQNDLALALETLLNFMRLDMAVERAIINLHHRETGRIFIHKSVGLTDEEQARGVYFPGEGITGQVVESAKPIIAPDRR